MGINMTKIMLVEDDKSLREIYGVRLLAEGYEIISAGDGEEALAMAIKEHPDLIVSDVMMPKISGFDMLDILRATPETKDIKVIMMTALSSEDQRARGEALGADRYLVKSQVGIEDVVKTVHEVLSDTQKTDVTPSQAFGTPAASETTVTTEQPEQVENTPATEQPIQPAISEPIAVTVNEPVSLPTPTISQPAAQPAEQPPAVAIDSSESVTAPMPETAAISEPEVQLTQPDVPSYSVAPATADPMNAPVQNESQQIIDESIVNDMTDRLNKNFRDGSDTAQLPETPEQTASQQ